MLQPRPDGRSQISKQLCSPRPSEADAVNESQQKTSLLRLLSLVRERNKPASAPYGMRRTNELLELYVLAKLITKPPGILELSTIWRSESLRRRRQSLQTTIAERKKVRFRWLQRGRTKPAQVSCVLLVRLSFDCFTHGCRACFEIWERPRGTHPAGAAN
jgi:hypothetical protein